MRCARLHCRGTIVAGEDGPVCSLCGRAPGMVATLILEREETRLDSTRDNGRTVAELPPGDDPLSEYERAARHYLATRQTLAETEAKLRDLEAGLSVARERLDRAHTRLHAQLGDVVPELATEGPASEVAPSAQPPPHRRPWLIGRKQSPETIAKRQATMAAKKAREEYGA